ncbi:MAG: transketolase [Candidatus Latescibacterota bacterium]
MMGMEGFQEHELSAGRIRWFQEQSRRAHGDILTMTTLSGCGHPGGSMSSVDIYLMLAACANVDPKNSCKPDRDRIVISHGHTSPGVYAAFGRLGFFELEEAIASFRRIGSIFEGHVEHGIPGIEWSTGNLGQGLSAGCGFALSGRLASRHVQVFVAMSDGEQTKGQVAEARRFAKKYELNNITVIMDYNELQISGSIHEVMPQHTKALYQADGWTVLEADGHDPQSLYQALRQAVFTEDTPVAILAHTRMGSGVSFMENVVKFHGQTLSEDLYRSAMAELGLEDDLDRYRILREDLTVGSKESIICHSQLSAPKIDTGLPRTYAADEKTDNRSAFGKALVDLGELNCKVAGRTPVVVLDCDLGPSVKTGDFGKAFPDFFFQGGVQEHHTATLAGALSKDGIPTFFADFGVFGVDETYNQHRLNDINETNVKLVCTHVGLDVGEDGKTHQCIDYIGLMRNLYGYRIIMPADPNQTDRAIRYIAGESGNFFVGMGRSKLPVITNAHGQPFFGGEYVFRYGKAECVRDGKDAAVISMGGMLHQAIEASERLAEHGFSVKVVNLSCLSAPDVEAIREAAATGVVVTYEDHNVHTGLGSIVAGVIADHGLRTRFKRMGVSEYGVSGTPEALFTKYGLDVESLVEAVIGEIERK